MKNKTLLLGIATILMSCSADEVNDQVAAELNCNCGTVHNWQSFNVAGTIETSFDLKNDCTGEIKHYENSGSYRNGDKKCK